jgi:hypothetical protein
VPASLGYESAFFSMKIQKNEKHWAGRFVKSVAKFEPSIRALRRIPVTANGSYPAVFHVEFDQMPTPNLRRGRR